MAAIAMSLQDMRDFVRDALDTDSSDLADDLLDRYIIDGSNRVEAYKPDWTFRAVDYSFTTVVGTQAYDIRSDSRVTGITEPILEIVDMRGPTWSLKPSDHLSERRKWAANTTSTNARPGIFTQWGDSVYLWPAPSEAVAISITGYRQGTDWVNLTPTAPDFPDEFHELIAWWALNRGHAREGDPQMADFYRGEFERELEHRARSWVKGLDAQPLVVGESRSRESFLARNGLGPLIYDWE